ncbi:MAG: Crp/Fnr family transcriptional regulator [Saprospiraceae bacterium]|nr:Crp/Fnr family transcriptional regulator [Saprospiraceae bacterium]
MKNLIQLQQKNCLECALKGHSVFSVLSDEQIEKINHHKSCAIYKKGQYLFTQFSRPVGLFCIYTGKIKLSTIGTDGKEQIIRLAKDGDIIGYRALMTEEHHRLSAIALEDSSVCLIEKDFFVKLAFQEPQLSKRVFKLISEDLRKAEEQIVSLSQKNVRERIAEALLFLKATYGLEADGKTLSVRLSREDFADYIGTSTESVIRLLSELNSSGIIELVGKKILINDIERLVRTANIIV